jgi:hypothetical protein
MLVYTLCVVPSVMAAKCRCAGLRRSLPDIHGRSTSLMEQIKNINNPFSKGPIVLQTAAIRQLGLINEHHETEDGRIGDYPEL